MPKTDNWRRWSTEAKREYLRRLQAQKPEPNKKQRRIVQECERSAAFFVNGYCNIYNATVRRWVRFDLWDAQVETLELMVNNRQVIVCKARQLGLSWLSLCYILWMMLFRPVAAVLLFSKRDDEAMELLRRLKGIYNHLPAYLRTEPVVVSSLHDWELGNGSRATAFATTGGRSYTASIVLIDEADFIPGLSDVLAAVQPTVDAGGQMIMISTVDKTKPKSVFKEMFRAARAQLTDWAHVFLSWRARPGRDQKWYERTKADIVSRTGSIDDLYQEYPDTWAEASAARSQDKRINGVWLSAIFADAPPLHPTDMPAVPGLTLYAIPQRLLSYVCGADPAEGNPNSDDSAATWLCVETGEEVAQLRGKFEPAIFGSYIQQIGEYFNNAPVLPERNNHGHSLILWLAENARKIRIIYGFDKKAGWLSNVKGKAMMYTNLANYAREHFKAESTVIHNDESYYQIGSIEGATLRAPKDEMDDIADSYALAVCGQIALFHSPVAMKQAKVKGRTGGPNIRTARRRKVQR